MSTDSTLMRSTLGGLLLAIANAVPAQNSHPSVACTLGATPLNFGGYSASRASPTDFSATLTVTCTTPSKDPVAVSGSLTVPSGDDSPPGRRRMSNRGQSLSYRIYSDSAHSTVWGDGSDGSSPVLISGMATRAQPLRQRFVVYGRVLARQRTGELGTYDDLVRVVLTY